MKIAGYQVVLEQGPRSWGARVPHLPGCAAVGDTEAHVKILTREAIEAHTALLRATGEREK